ncbi:hypothetical protein HK102_000638 [Quaeritorhiza haematococci]|nr:hypothetical protein HK102_000638 [Quaeritorhiza haematococci]
MPASDSDKKIPVTVLTGFLGSGKTTLMNYILKAYHGKRIAVIENEFGEVGIDDALVKIDSEEEVFEMNNGCICCTVRGDLIRILGTLAKKKDKFDMVLVETTGLADPAPVAQTFFVDPDVQAHYILDAIVTMVDCKFLLMHLDEEKPEDVENEAVEQIAFADRILLNKTDLVTPAEIETLKTRIRGINAVAQIYECAPYAKLADLDLILNVRGFDLGRITAMDPEFLVDQDHQHDQSVSSVGITHIGTINSAKFNSWISVLLRERGVDLFRSKGVLHFAPGPSESKGEYEGKRFVFQAVHMLFGGELEDIPGGPLPKEKKENRLVFIGRNLVREELVKAFEACIAE